MCERTHRFDALRADWVPEKADDPHPYWDSDTAKWLEAACYACAIREDELLRSQIESTVDLFVAAQLPDGYLNSRYAAREPERRWKNLRLNHELYCAGHLFEAAVAHFELTGSRRLLDVACRFADHIDAVFGPEPKIPGYCGHPEIELALVRLFRVTKESRYLELAAFFVDQRGQRPHWFDREREGIPGDVIQLDVYHDYFQAHKPVREQEEAVGHAVRAMYLYCAMADLAAERGDASLLEACERLWKNVVSTKLYVTGGIGSTWQGEAFTKPYDLPNERAYCETCASVGLIFWAQRMLEHRARSEYANVIERALYNGALSGMSLDGKRFFYQNPLVSLGGHHRQEWFWCACCPSNLSRLLARLGGLLFSHRNDELLIHLYVGGEGEFALENGVSGTLRQSGGMPWNGDVRVDLTLAKPAVFTLGFRVPDWAEEATFAVNGERQPVGLRDGYALITREWSSGDRVDIQFSMEIRRLVSHAKVTGNSGMVALQRGPFVYCIEDADFEGSVLDIRLPRESVLEAVFDSGCPGGGVVLKGEAEALIRSEEEPLYCSANAHEARRVPFQAVPFYAWDNRTQGAMRVWIPQ